MTDAVMPKLGGVELIRRLQAAGHGGCAIIMSRYSHELLAESPSRPVAQFLAKPFHGDDLLATVRRALGQERELRT